MEGLTIFLCCIAVGMGLSWGEAAFLGRPKLRADVEARGYKLTSARWLPLIWSHKAAFRITLEREGQSWRGRAFVGSAWFGPVRSSKVVFDSGDGEPLS